MVQARGAGAGTRLCDGGGEKRWESGYILESEMTRCAGNLGLGCKRKRGMRGSHWKHEMAPLGCGGSGWEGRKEEGRKEGERDGRREGGRKEGRLA